MAFVFIGGLLYQLDQMPCDNDCFDVSNLYLSVGAELMESPIGGLRLLTLKTPMILSHIICSSTNIYPATLLELPASMFPEFSLACWYISSRTFGLKPPRIDVTSGYSDILARPIDEARKKSEVHGQIGSIVNLETKIEKAPGLNFILFFSICFGGYSHEHESVFVRSVSDARPQGLPNNKDCSLITKIQKVDNNPTLNQVITIGFSANTGYLIGDTKEHCRWFPFLKSIAWYEASGNFKASFLVAVQTGSENSNSKPLTNSSKSSVVEEEDEVETFNDNLGAVFVNLLTSLCHLPVGMHSVLIVMTLTWLSWFPFFLFYTDWMGREVYHGDPKGDTTKVQAYDDGVRERAFGGSLLMKAIGREGESILALETLKRVVVAGNRAWHAPVAQGLRLIIMLGI
ncbi:unnamed protein product [Lactuca saligna]|uniref:Uncharacterized protein n=1 Tax=Lactuca saligna TaxID=75948 RepID=A0AA35ZWJ5_LACSI|nr:unnamed protein product [Lactuca saligna]